MNNMKIVIIGTAYPMRGGIAHYVALLYKILLKRGHEVKIISFKRQYPSLFFPGKTQQDLSKVPEGFEPLPMGLGFTDQIQPTFRRVTDEGVSVGLLVGEQHANTMGICHGGVLMTLADVAAATGLNFARGVMAGSPTINLAVDFVSAAKMGEWIQSKINNVTIKRRFGFCDGVLMSDRGVVVRFNGTFYFPDHKGLWQGGKSESDLPGALGDDGISLPQREEPQ